MKTGNSTPPELGVATDGVRATRRDVLLKGGAAAAGLAFAPVLAACGGSAKTAAGGGSASASSTPLDTLIVAVDQDINTWDPQYVNGSPATQTIIQNMFDEFVQVKRVSRVVNGTEFELVDTQTFLPQLAAAWSVSGNKLVYTLRPGLTYDNGDPLGAREIVKGYEREFARDNTGGFLMALAGVPKLGDVRALDDRRVEFTFETGRPGPLFHQIQTAINMSILSPRQVKQHATRADPTAQQYFTTHPAAGNGPYTFGEYVPGDHVTLKANPRWYGKAPALKTIVQKVVPDGSQRSLLLLRGDADVLFHPSVSDLDDLEGKKGINVLSIPSPRQYMFEMNMKIAPFDNKLVRQAVCYAIPYDTIVRDVFHGRANAMRSFVPEGMPGSDPSAFKYATNIAKAKQALAQAGHPNGQGLPPIRITVSIGAQEDTQAAIVIQSALQAIGMKAQVQRLPIGPYSDLRGKRKLQCDIFNSLWFVNDPWFAIGLQLWTQGVANYFNYSNPQVDALYERWMLSDDAAGRLEASKQAQAIITEDAPIGYLCSPNYNIVVRDNVHGYTRYNDELTRYVLMSKTAA